MLIISSNEITNIKNAETLEEQKKIFWDSFKLVKQKFPDVRCKYYCGESGLLESISIFTFYEDKPQGLKEVKLSDLQFVTVEEEDNKCVVGRMVLRGDFYSPFI